MTSRPVRSTGQPAYFRIAGIRQSGPALPQVVHTGSEVCVEARARNPWQSMSQAPGAVGACFWAKARASKE